MDVSARALAAARLGFGIVWAIDAWLKWQPGFMDGFAAYLTGAASAAQPTWVDNWIHFWLFVVHVDPKAFCHMVALGESAIAVALLVGVGVRAVAVLGSLLSLLIWTTAEGFGGPYTSGATDVGASIIYVGVFALLALTQAGYAYGLDGRWRLTGWSWRRAHDDTLGPTAPAEPAGIAD
ncbi:MAG: DoxX family membrane protein [Firmicutes bacterium]|nr:DoxX family membrane protein [Bacillota bacterium]